MADPASLDKPKKAKFSWINDPAAGVRGKGKARISNDDQREMVDYNRQLIEPLDRGGGQNLRIDGQPVRLAGDVPARTAAPTWQQPLDRTGLARITSRYGDGRPPIVTVPSNPNLGPGGPTVSTLGGPINPPPVVESQDPRIAFFDSVRDPTPPNPNNTPAQPVVPPTNPAFEGAAGADGAGAGRLTGQTNFGQTGEELGGGGPGTTNPITGAPVDTGLRDWLAGGGTLATWHRQQVRSGSRAPIDAHAAPDPLRSTASDEIRAAHGFRANPEADAATIAKQMTGEFNANNSQSQAAWNQKFTTAHENLMKALNNNTN